MIACSSRGLPAVVPAWAAFIENWNVTGSEGEILPHGKVLENCRLDINLALFRGTNMRSYEPGGCVWCLRRAQAKISFE